MVPDTECFHFGACPSECSPREHQLRRCLASGILSGSSLEVVEGEVDPDCTGTDHVSRLTSSLPVSKGT